MRACDLHCGCLRVPSHLQILVGEIQVDLALLMGKVRTPAWVTCGSDTAGIRDIRPMTAPQLMQAGSRFGEGVHSKMSLLRWPESFLFTVFSLSLACLQTRRRRRVSRFQLYRKHSQHAQHEVPIILQHAFLPN